MCGISVMINHGDMNLTHVHQKVHAEIKHRGPDAEGFLFDEDCNLSLGHNRLSIISLENNSQPMTDPSGRFTIVFNGEITNFADFLAPDSTGGDTEALISAWEAKGPDCLRELRGQFAFSILDRKLNSIFFCTDHFGILPLYCLNQKDFTVYSSSLTSLIEFLGDRCISAETVETLLNYRFVSAPKTILNGIERLPPRSVWEYGIASGKTLKKQYSPVSLGDKKVVATKGDLREALIKAVSRSLVADVPIGLYLSGGLDSTLIAHIIKKEFNRDLDAFTINWSGSNQVSELQYAENTCRALGMKLHPVTISPDSWWSAMERGLRFRDAPYGELADVAVFELAETASRHVKVVLTGEGADELFLGYRKYKFEKLASKESCRKLIKVVNSEFSHLLSGRIARLLSTASIPDADARAKSYFKTLWPAYAEINGLDQLNGTPKEKVDSVRTLQAFDLDHWLPYILLDRADRMNMAHGVESRPVYLDVDLAVILNSFDSRVLSKGWRTKSMLREIASHYLPRESFTIAKKGFPLPVTEWFRTHLYEQVQFELTQDCKVLDVFLPKDIRLRILNDHRSARKDWTMAIFSMISIQMWTKQFGIELS